MIRNGMLIACIMTIGCGRMPGTGEVRDEVIAEDHEAARSEVSRSTLPEVEDREAPQAGWPAGVFESTGAWGELNQLVLERDGRFHLVVQCPPKALCAAHLLRKAGAYRFTRRGSTRYVVLFADGQLYLRYAYRFDGQRLELRAEELDEWFAMERAAE